MKNSLKIIVIIVFVIFAACKSTYTAKNNKNDIVKTVNELSENTIKVNQIRLFDSEIVLIPAIASKPTIITDASGNTQKFENVKSISIKKKSTVKKDVIVSNKKEVAKKTVDKSIIKEKTESISDTNNYKTIFIAIAFSLLFLLIIYLVFKFKK